MNAPLAIGVGCRRACPSQTIVDLVRKACAGLDMSGAGLFTIEAKRGEAGIVDAASQLGLPLTCLAVDRLNALLPGVTTRSERVTAAVGVPSVAEASALAGAGSRGRLVVSRLAEGGATCAVALSDGVA